MQNQHQRSVALIGLGSKLAPAYLAAISQSDDIALSGIAVAGTLAEALGVPLRQATDVHEIRLAHDCGQVAHCSDPALLAQTIAADLLIETTDTPFEAALSAAAALERGISVLVVQPDTLTLYGQWLAQLAAQSGARLTCPGVDEAPEAALARACLPSGPSDLALAQTGPQTAYAADDLPAGTALTPAMMKAHHEAPEANRPYDFHEGLPIPLHPGLYLKRPVPQGRRIRLSDCTYSEHDPRFALWRQAQSLSGAHRQLAAE
ncbi:hypothetical protein [Pseudoprimorskyibacter insulae]|uniref:Gfo/Idh/MocA-like oxidoreductase N-terminal domain-containing protein n=1 Tax=Pseudoprimorskyibacter insulae TaxID=1695997 RepID=A0A2R8AYF6_9RHOB|nr:hypothetical protein [Pseudoprimorskyibacter insulae]SPF81063.1 hypothetical protein PRI8871_02880 [Pseudoprimorskyibacter insulae]